MTAYDGESCDAPKGPPGSPALRRPLSLEGPGHRRSSRPRGGCRTGASGPAARLLKGDDKGDIHDGQAEPTDVVDWL
jgi:hypothetical protein